MYEQLVNYIKKNFTKAINDMINKKCIQDNDEEQEKLLKGDFTEYKELALIVQNKGCSKYTRMIERNITNDAKHIQVRWTRSSRIATLETKLENTLDHNEKDKISNELRSEKFEALKFSHFYMDSDDVFHETFDDDSLINRAMRNANSLKTPPFAKQTALLTVTHSYKTDKQLAIIN